MQEPSSENQEFSPLRAWIERKAPLPGRFYKKSHADIPHPEWGVWIGIENQMPLHEAHTSKSLGLKDARNKTKSYLKGASKLINGLSGGWLDSEERYMILEDLGQPPGHCLPLYLITTGSGEEEQLEYIGKTKTAVRFHGGHTAAMKLHHPKYDGVKKTIYRCSIWFHIDNEYIALDWIQPEALALKLLDYIEWQAIYNLQPRLNTQKTKRFKGKWDFYIHIQNFSGSDFLNDRFLG